MTTRDSHLRQKNEKKKVLWLVLVAIKKKNLCVKD